MPRKKNPAAVALGRKGGKATARKSDARAARRIRTQGCGGAVGEANNGSRSGIEGQTESMSDTKPEKLRELLLGVDIEDVRKAQLLSDLLWQAQQIIKRDGLQEHFGADWLARAESLFSGPQKSTVN